MATLELSNVVKSFDKTTIIHGVDLAVSDGEFVVFVGPSGCGKSTLLRIISGLEPATSGDIRIDGQRVNEVSAAHRGCSMVFQSYALYPHMSVYDNMAFGLENLGVAKPEIERKVNAAAALLQLTPLLQRKPTQLSGGQRQRVAIGRSIVREPKLFLFDEPLSNLDAELRVSMRAEIRDLHARLGATMIYVTHDQVEAMTMASRIVVLNAGRIEQVGSPFELYRNPDNFFVAGFLGAPRMNFFAGRVVQASMGHVTVQCPLVEQFEVQVVDGAGLAVGDGVTIGVRPEALVIDRDGGFPAKVHLVENLGRETILYADAGALQTIGSDTGTANLTVHLPDVAQFAKGDPVRLRFDPADAYLFGGAGQATLSVPKSI